MGHGVEVNQLGVQSGEEDSYSPLSHCADDQDKSGTNFILFHFLERETS